jgi:hypothetical protein
MWAAGQRGVVAALMLMVVREEYQSWQISEERGAEP